LRVPIVLMLLISTLVAEQLSISADNFSGSEKSGVSIFDGSVKIKKGFDELNASVVEVTLNEKSQPIKYVAKGSVSIRLRTENGSIYTGSAERIVFLPYIEEYRFYDNVQLRQIDKHKQINGDEVVVNIKDGTAVARGDGKRPVIMVFDLPDGASVK